MRETDGGGAALKAIAVAAIALAGFVASLTPLGPRLEDMVLDGEWRLLRAFAPREAPDDIVIVGVDPATVAAIPEPPPLWHASLGLALARIASSRPRAIALELPLPERSYEGLRPGLDRAFLTGLAAAAQNGPFVAALAIDARTRSARQVYAPYLALLGNERLAIGLIARDADGTTRRFSLIVPTEDGGYPTLVGRLCRALAAPCSDGLIDFSLGPRFRYVPLRTLLDARDMETLGKVFRDRIVLIGETQPYGSRIAVPLNMAGWEPERGDSPSIVVHAQSLRTALAGAPMDVSRPWAVLLLSAAALVFLVRRVPLMLATALLAALGLLLAALASLHAGVHLPAAGAFATLALASLARIATAVLKIQHAA